MRIELLLAITIAAAAGCSGPSTAEQTPPTAPLKARERPLSSVDVAELNDRLAAKMGFGTASEVQDLLKQGATAAAKNRYGLPVIFMAAQRGDAAILEALIQAGADVNAQIGTSYNDDGVGYAGTTDGTPLSYAAAAGHLEAMELLKQSGADANGQGPAGTSPLMSAAEHGQLRAVRWLIANGATAGREKALALALRVGNPNATYKEIIQLLSK